MAGFDLGISRALFPWHQAGLKYILCDNTEDIAELHIQAKQNHFVVQRTVPSTICPPSSLPSVQKHVSPRTSQPFAQAGQQQPVSSPQAASKGLPQQKTTPSSTDSHILHPSRWPETWQALLARTPKTPLLVWSYPELQDDLGGRSDRQRGDALRRLFADLALPRGSHAFWPLIYPINENKSVTDATCNAAFFYSGVAALRPRTVLLLCNVQPAELNLPPLGILQSTIYKGIRFVRLYGIQNLISDMAQSPARYARLVQFLRTLCR